MNHLGLAALEDAAGIKFSIVPYKGGGPCMTSIIGGHIDLGCHGAEAAPFLESNKLRPLVFFGTKRFYKFPEIPIGRDLGYDIVIYQLTSIGVPRGTPEETKKILVEAFRRAAENDQFKKFMDRMGIEGTFLGPEETGKFLKSQNDNFRAIVDKIGLKPK
jgi:tripartite-type tricarboxylate transporter receptor subunit TctC